jgi:octaprenyl-diphosphate synthase
MLAVESKLTSASAIDSSKTSSDCSWKRLVEPVEPFLRAVTQRLFEQIDAFDPKIIPYAQYALNGNGKQLRPALVALAASSIGKTTDAHVNAAAIVEMAHLATLVHDDVLDEAEIRRGQPTLAANWGNEIAVLFGDCLFAQALKLAASFPTPEVCRVVAAAANNVCAGELLQTQQRRQFQVSQRDYFRVIEMKTAELFMISCDLAALLSRTTAERRTALGQFGLGFGAAYQVYDDCVDLFGSEETAGKSLGTDLAKGKLTWPVLLAWERADVTDKAQLENWVKEWQPENFFAVKELLVKHETFEPSRAVVNRYLDQARYALRILPKSDGRTGMLKLADFLAQQTDALAVCVK